MIYHFKRDELTGRIKCLLLEANTSTEELLLTKMFQVFDEYKGHIEAVTADGNALRFILKKEDDQHEN